MSQIHYQSLAWYAQDVETEDDELRYVIKNFGRDESGKSVSVSITGFKPFFYVKVPDEWCTNSSLLKFKGFIESHLNTYEPVVKLFEKKEFWGFTNKTLFKFFKLEFNSLKCVKGAVSKLGTAVKIPGLSGTSLYKFQLYETNIEPFLRMIHIRKLQPSGWITIDKYSKKTDILPSINEIDINCDWKSLHHFNTTNMAPFIVASFDIECTSSGGDFPVPKKDYRQMCNQLFAIWNTVETKEMYYKHESIIASMIFALTDSDIPCKHHITRVKTKKVLDEEILKNEIRNHIDDIVAILNTKTTKHLQNYFESAKWLSPLKGDEIIQIGTTFHRFGEKECYYKHIITLGSCDNLNGIDVVQCETEEELLMKWNELIQTTNPDIITGYNIFGFDFSYIKERAEELNIDEEFMKLSRLKHFKSEYVEQLLSSSALGDNKLKYIKMQGRVLIDMMKVVQRDHKLDSYKLDNVAKHFTGQQKDDVGPKEIFKLQKGNATDRAIIAKYCVQDCALCNHLIIKIDIITNNMGMSNVCLVPLEYIFMRGQGIKIYSLVLNECHHQKFVIPTMKKSFSVKDEQVKKIVGDNLEKGLMSKLTSEITRISKACDGDTRMQNSMYSNIASSFVMCAAENLNIDVSNEMLRNAFPYGKKFEIDKVNLIVKDNLMNKESCVIDDDSYEGAIVLNPKQGIYIDRPVSVFDYASLYPSSMISENLSHDCIVLDEKYDNLPGLNYNEVAYDIYNSETKEKIGQRVCRYVEYPDGEKGIIPNILKKLLGARKMTRKKIQYQTDPETGHSGLYNSEKHVLKDLETNEEFLVNDPSKLVDTFNSFQTAVLDGLQLAYKITANSLYGQIGAKTSQIYMKDIAACTTATGRNMIMLAKDYMEKNYGAEVIYGDTDSIFCIFPSIEEKGHSAIMPSINIASDASKKIKPILKAPHDLEYEKTFWPFILLSKKRYVGNLYEMDDKKFKQKSMGIVLKRRDNSNIVKHVYGGIIDTILNEQNITKSIDFLTNCLNDLINGKFSLDQLVLSKSLKGDYKDASKIAHKVLADRIAERDPGNKPEVNDRIPYVYITSDNPHALQGEKIETPDYIVQEKLTPDYSFYITNQIMNPVIQIYALIINELPGFASKYGEQYLNNMWNNIITDIKDEDTANIKFDTIKEVIVKELLFDPILTKIPNTKIKKSLLKKKYEVDAAEPKKKPETKKKGKTKLESNEGEEVPKKRKYTRKPKEEINHVYL